MVQFVLLEMSIIVLTLVMDFVICSQILICVYITLLDLQTEHDRECQKIVKTAYDEASVVNPLVRNSIVILEMNESNPLQVL